jgi:type IV secretory pathway VirB2 component (pilin)
MDIANILSDITTFFQGNVPAAIAVLIIVLFLAYKKPKLFFTLFFLVILLIGIVYIITFVSDIGTTHKKTIIQKRTVP